MIKELSITPRSAEIHQSANAAEQGEFIALLHSTLADAWKVLMPLAVLAILCASMREGTFSVPIFFAIFFIIGWLILHFIGGTDREEAYRLFVSIYAFNVIVVVFFFYAFQVEYGNHYLTGGTDDMYYDHCASHAANHLRLSGEFDIPRIYSEDPELSPERFEHYRSYIGLLAGISYLSDAIAQDMHTLNLRLINSLAIGLMAVIVFLISLSGGLPRNLSYIAGFLAGVYPSQAFWGAVIVRDNLVVLFSVTIVYCLQQIISGVSSRRWSWVIPLIIMLVFSSLMRTESGLLMAGLIFSTLFFCVFRDNGWMIRGLLIGLTGVSVWLFLILFSVYSDFFFLMIELQTQYRMGFAEGLSSYVFGIPLVPFGLIIRPIYALIAPFPSLLVTSQNIFETIGVAGVFLMLPFVFIGFWNSLFDHTKFIWGIFAVGLLMLISWTTFHDRHFLTYRPFMFLLMVYGWTLAKQPRDLLIIQLLVGTALAIVYLVLKILTV